MTTASPSMDLFDLFETYRLRKLRGAAKMTIRQYLTSLRQYEKFLERTPTLEDLNDDSVLSFCWSRIEAGLSRESAVKNTKNLLAIWRFACRRGLLTIWPDVELPSRPERTPNAWTREQLAALFKAVEMTPGGICGVAARFWWRALLYVIWDSGERISAVLSLKWEDVDLNGGWFTIRAEKRKWKRRDKSWKLHPETVDALRWIIVPGRELVFEMDFTYSALFDRFSTILKRAGLPATRRHKFHALRRSVASWFERAGGNATELLDHSSRDVTKAYLDPRIVQQSHACDALFRPSDSKSETPTRLVPPEPVSPPPIRYEELDAVPAPKSVPHERQSIPINLAGEVYMIGGACKVLLRILLANPGGIVVRDANTEMVAAGFRPRTIHVIIDRLRQFMRNVLRLPETVDPISQTKAVRRMGCRDRSSDFIRLTIRPKGWTV